MQLFDDQGVSFVSVTQQFNTTTSMGWLTLNMPLSFVQFEREVAGERIRDKLAATSKRGVFVTSQPPSASGEHAKGRRACPQRPRVFREDVFESRVAGEGADPGEAGRDAGVGEGGLGHTGECTGSCDGGVGGVWLSRHTDPAAGSVARPMPRPPHSTVTLG